MQRYRRVLGYARVSSAAQGERGTSLDGQRDEITAYCTRSKLPAPELYVEVESAGAEKIERRRELKRLIAAARPGDLVVACKVDRWSRDIVFAVQSVRELVARGVGWLSIGEGIDAATPNGDSLLGIMAWAADQERIRIRERTIGRRRALRAQGRFVEGTPPLGYTRDRERKTLVVDPEGAEVVREIFRRCLAGETTRDISDALRARHPGLGGLNYSRIGQKIRDRTYLGETRERADDGEWQATHPPIVDRATWARAQEVLSSRRAGRPAESASSTADFLARGLLRCAVCGYTMRCSVGKYGHLGYYACRIRVDGRRSTNKATCATGPIARRDEIEPELARVTVEHLRVLAAELARPPRAVEERARPNFAAKRSRIVAARARLVDAIADGLITRDEAKAKLAALDTQQREIENAEAVVEAPVETRPRAEVLREVRAMARAWDAMTVEERRATIDRLAESISVGPDRRLRVKWRALP